jgi:hypothetical protein
VIWPDAYSADFQENVEEYARDSNNVVGWMPVGKRAWCASSMMFDSNVLDPLTDQPPAGQTLETIGTWRDNSVTDMNCSSVPANKTVVDTIINYRVLDALVPSLDDKPDASIAATISIDWQYVNFAGYEGFIAARAYGDSTKFNYFKLSSDGKDTLIPQTVSTVRNNVFNDGGTITSGPKDGPGLASTPEKHALVIGAPTAQGLKLRLDYMIGAGNDVSTIPPYTWDLIYRNLFITLPP